MTPELSSALQAFIRLRNQLVLEYPELTTDSDICLFDTLDGMTELQDKLRSLVRKALERESMADGMVHLVERLASRQARLKRGAENIRSIVKDVMTEAGLNKLKADDFSASISVSKPSVVITDETLLPEETIRIKREPDKTKIKSFLDIGIAVPGATLSNTGMKLTIRTN